MPTEISNFWSLRETGIDTEILEAATMQDVVNIPYRSLNIHFMRSSLVKILEFEGPHQVKP